MRNRLIVLAAGLVFAASVASVAVVAGRGDGPLEKLPVGAMGGAAEGRATSTMSADSASSLSFPAFGAMEYRVKGTLPALGGTAAAYRLPTTTTKAKVAELAGILGLRGTVHESADRFIVLDGERQLSVERQPGVPWYMGGTCPGASVSDKGEVVCPEDARLKDLESRSSGGGSAGSAGSGGGVAPAECPQSDTPTATVLCVPPAPDAPPAPPTACPPGTSCPALAPALSCTPSCPRPSCAPHVPCPAPAPAVVCAPNTPCPAPAPSAATCPPNTPCPAPAPVPAPCPPGASCPPSVAALTAVACPVNARCTAPPAMPRPCPDDAVCPDVPPTPPPCPENAKCVPASASVTPCPAGTECSTVSTPPLPIDCPPEKCAVSCAAPVPADCPGCEPGIGLGDCGNLPQPVRPADLPSRAAAEAQARALFARLGAGSSRFELHDGFLSWSALVQHELGGVPVLGWSTNVGIGSKGVLEYANGYLASPERLGDYPLAGTEVGLKRLREGLSAFGGGSDDVHTLEAQTEPAIEPAIDLPAPSDECAKPTVICDPPAGRPEPGPPPVMTITGAHLGLQQVEDRLVPVYVFELEEGGETWGVPAVVDELLESHTVVDG